MAPPRELEVYVVCYPGINCPNLSQVLPPLFPAGLSVRVEHRLETLPSAGMDEFGAVTETKLARDLAAYLSGLPPRAESDPWLACVFAARWLWGQQDVNGILVDADPSWEAQGYQRAGCGVFLGSTGTDWLFRRTVTHELGHVLNLDHADAEPGCVMLSSPGALTEPIVFRPRAATHLVSHPIPEVRPGGMVFGAVVDNLHPAREGGIHSRSSVEVGLSLRSGMRADKGNICRFVIGDPPILRTVVRNRATRRSIALECGTRGKLRVRLRYRQSGEPWQQLHRLRVACTTSRNLLRPGDSIAHEIILPQRPESYFTTPGTYEISTVVHVDGRPMASVSRIVQALPPPTQRQSALVRRLLHPAVVSAVERGLVTKSGRSHITRLTATLPRRHLMRARLLLALGRSAAEESATFRSSKRLARARRLLGRARIAGDGFVRREATHWLKRLNARPRIRAKSVAPSKAGSNVSPASRSARRRRRG